MKQEEMNISQLMAFALAQFIDQGENVRCVTSGGGCQYMPTHATNLHSKGCLVGILIEDSKLKTDMDQVGDGFRDMIHNLTEHSYDEEYASFKYIVGELPKILVDYKDVVTEFQGIHDTSQNWREDNQRLSVMGTVSLANIISKYDYLDVEDFLEIFEKSPEITHL